MSRLTLPLSMLVSLLLLTACSKMGDETLAILGDKSISLDEFTQKHPAARFADKDNDFVDKKIDDYVGEQLFILAAFDQGYEQDSLVLQMKTGTERRLMLQQVYEKAIVEGVIDESALRETYDNSGTELKARHILLQFSGTDRSTSGRSKKEALVLAGQLKARLENGESFEALAKEYTDDPSGRDSGGDLGWFVWGQMVGPFQEAAFALNPGEVSGVVETDFGYHIIKLEEKRKVERGSFEEEQPKLLALARREKAKELSQRAAAFIEEQKTASGFALNVENIHEFFGIYEKSAYKNLFMDDVFKKIPYTKPLLWYRGKDRSGKWIIDELKYIEESQKPRFASENQLKTILDQIVIQSVIIDYGFSHGLEKDEVFESRVSDAISRMVYDAFVKKEIDALINPGEDDLMAYYDKYKAEKYMDKKMVRVSEIFVKDSLLAVDLKKRIDAGEEITALAGRYSERRVGKENKGDLPPFQEGRYGAMGKKAFGLEIGVVAGPLKLGNGYSIIRLEERIPEKATPFEQVRPRIKSQLANELRAERKAELVKELRKTYSVRVNYAAAHAFYAEKESSNE